MSAFRFVFPFFDTARQGDALAGAIKKRFSPRGD